MLSKHEEELKHKQWLSQKEADELAARWHVTPDDTGDTNPSIHLWDLKEFTLHPRRYGNQPSPTFDSSGLQGRTGYLLFKTVGWTDRPGMSILGDSHTVLMLFYGTFETKSKLNSEYERLKWNFKERHPHLWSFVAQATLPRDGTCTDEEEWWKKLGRSFLMQHVRGRKIRVGKTVVGYQYDEPVVVVESYDQRMHDPTEPGLATSMFEITSYNNNKPELSPLPIMVVSMERNESFDFFRQTPIESAKRLFEMLQHNRYGHGMLASSEFKDLCKPKPNSLFTSPPKQTSLCGARSDLASEWTTLCFSQATEKYTHLGTLIEEYRHDCVFEHIEKLSAYRRIGNIDDMNLQQTLAMSWLFRDRTTPSIRVLFRRRQAMDDNNEHKALMLFTDSEFTLHRSSVHTEHTLLPVQSRSYLFKSVENINYMDPEDNPAWMSIYHNQSPFTPKPNEIIIVVYVVHRPVALLESRCRADFKAMGVNFGLLPCPVWLTQTVDNQSGRTIDTPTNEHVNYDKLFQTMLRQEWGGYITDAVYRLSPFPLPTKTETLQLVQNEGFKDMIEYHYEKTLKQ